MYELYKIYKIMIYTLYFLFQREQIIAEYKARVLGCHPDKHPNNAEKGLLLDSLCRLYITIIYLITGWIIYMMDGCYSGHQI